MKRQLAGIALVLMCGTSLAATSYTAGLTVTRIWLSGANAYVYTDPQPADTCSYWGAYLVFDHTTQIGRSYLSTLLVAKTSGSVIDAWYSFSSSPGSNQTNGCDSAAVSTLQQLRLE